MGMFALRAGPLKARFHRNAAHAISVEAVEKLIKRGVF